MRRRALLASPLLLATPALAQSGYPDRSVRFIVPFPPGGGTDTWARIASEGMQPEFGQPIVIENRGGAGGVLGTEYAAKVPPDGYQLLFTITTHVQTPVVMRRFPYDPVEDFAPIGRLGTSNTTFVVGPKVPATVTTLPEFVRWAEGRDLSFGSYAAGSTGHAFAMMLAEEARLKMEHIAYRGESPMLQEILSGSIHGGWHSMAAAGEMMHAGRVRPLASSGTSRIPSMPNVPLISELGYSDRFQFTGFSGLLAPVRTPRAILEKLDQVFSVAANKPATLARLRQIDTIPSYLNPAEFRAHLVSSLARWTAITNQLDLRIDS